MGNRGGDQRLATTLIGGGLDPLMVGALNDSLAPDFGGDAIRYSFIVISVLYVLASAFYLACSRYIAGDLDRQPPSRSSESAR